MPNVRHSPQNVLVTGGAGFIGVNFIEYLLAADPGVRIVTLDLLTYAASPDDLERLGASPRHLFVRGDIADRELVDGLLQKYAIDTIVHLAAESHVDRSIDSPSRFVLTNVLGTQALLEAARHAWGDRARARGVRFHHVSTDEVYGSLAAGDPPFTESSPYAPRSPYAASKAAADHLVRAYFETYGLPVSLSNSSNNYGPYQHAEKFIPTVIRSCLAGAAIPLYGTGMNIRDWLFVRDHCRAIDLVVRQGEPGLTYLVGAQNECRNIDLVHRICRLLDELHPRADGRTYDELITPVRDRPGHDFRYAIDAARMTAELGWRPVLSFEDGLRATVSWYLERWSEHLPADTRAAWLNATSV